MVPKRNVALVTFRGKALGPMVLVNETSFSPGPWLPKKGRLFLDLGPRSENVHQKYVKYVGNALKCIENQRKT
jgi:hypothetical protein